MIISSIQPAPPSHALLSIARNSIATLEAVSPALRHAYTRGDLSDEQWRELSRRLDGLFGRVLWDEPVGTTPHHTR